MAISLDELLKKAREVYDRTHSIRCPKCGHEFDEESRYPHVTYWGSEDGPTETSCENCGIDFLVKEKVDRTWETAVSRGGFE